MLCSSLDLSSLVFVCLCLRLNLEHSEFWPEPKQLLNVTVSSGVLGTFPLRLSLIMNVTLLFDTDRLSSLLHQFVAVGCRCTCVLIEFQLCQSRPNMPQWHCRLTEILHVYWQTSALDWTNKIQDTRSVCLRLLLFHHRDANKVGFEVWTNALSCWEVLSCDERRWQLLGCWRRFVQHVLAVSFGNVPICPLLLFLRLPGKQYVWCLTRIKVTDAPISLVGQIYRLRTRGLFLLNHRLSAVGRRRKQQIFYMYLEKNTFHLFLFYYYMY